MCGLEPLHLFSFSLLTSSSLHLFVLLNWSDWNVQNEAPVCVRTATNVGTTFGSHPHFLTEHWGADWRWNKATYGNFKGSFSWTYQKQVKQMCVCVFVFLIFWGLNLLWSPSLWGPRFVRTQEHSCWSGLRPRCVWRFGWGFKSWTPAVQTVEVYTEDNYTQLCVLVCRTGTAREGLVSMPDEVEESGKTENILHVWTLNVHVHAHTR